MHAPIKVDCFVFHASHLGDIRLGRILPQSGTSMTGRFLPFPITVLVAILYVPGDWHSNSPVQEITLYGQGS
jgi:hypothetical protein